MTALTRAAFAIPVAALAFAGAALFQAPIHAQAPPSSSQSGLSSGMDLTAAQRAKADVRQAQFKKDIQALQADTKMSNPQKQAKYTALYQAMDRDMLAILTPAQRTLVLKQRQVNIQFQKGVLALQGNRTLTDAQKKTKYLQLTQNARNASIALLPAAQRPAALKRSQEAEQAQQAQAAKIAEAKRLGQQLQKSESPAQSQKLSSIALTTGTAIQSVIANKTLSPQAQTAKIVALRQDALKRDLALLNPAQRSLYSRIQALITASPAR